MSLLVVQLSRSNNSKRSGAGVSILETVIQVVRLSVQQHAKSEPCRFLHSLNG